MNQTTLCTTQKRLPQKVTASLIVRDDSSVAPPLPPPGNSSIAPSLPPENSNATPPVPPQNSEEKDESNSEDFPDLEVKRKYHTFDVVFRHDLGYTHVCLCAYVRTRIH